MDIKKFRMDQITPGKVILACGKRATGKSSLVVDMLHYLREQIPCAVCVSGSEEGNGFYSRFFPPVMIYSQYDPEIIRRVIARQKKVLKRIENGEKDLNPNCLLLLDDCAFDKSIFRSKEMRFVAMNGRHFRLTVVITVQYLVDIPPDVRTNIDYIFALRENMLLNKEKIYKFFFGIFPDFHTFNQAFQACTHNYECLVCNNTTSLNEIAQCVFWYKAALYEPFRFGHPEFWNLAENAYNKDYDEDIDEDIFDKKPTYKVRKPAITIKKLE